MIRVSVLLALLLAVPPARAQSAPSQSGFEAGLAGEVYVAALAFMAPRILEPVPVSQLTLWGLRGLTALDPRLEVAVGEQGLLLTLGGRLLYARPLPADEDPLAWGGAAAELCAAAWGASPALRRAGSQGVVKSFFDEVFNHFDPYSRYVPPAEAAEDRARRSGDAGVGLTLALRGGIVVADEVIAGSPAAEGGIRPGDSIVAVNGQPTRRRAVATVADWIDGSVGTKVTLTWRGRDKRSRTAELVRALVPPETVYAQRIDAVLVLRVTNFDRTTAAHLAAALTQGLAAARRTDGIILDLRDNRGGLLRQAVGAADILLPAGTVVVTAGRDPQASRIWESAPGELAENVPVVVLVDGRTASAAEILAAALADRGRAVVVGSSTLGKGLVQTIDPLPDGGELFVTWSRVLAPLGWPIQGLGVLPQVCTSLGQDAMERELHELREGQQPLVAALEAHREARAPLPAAQVLALRAACPAAEGSDDDLRVARYLIAHPDAYAAALLPPMREQAPAP